MGLQNLFGKKKEEETTMPPAEKTQVDPAATNQAVVEKIEEVAAKVKTLDLEEEADSGSSLLRPEMRPHAFVIMPFGKKKGGDGSLYDFNAIYTLLIKPTLESAGFEAFRADEETTSGDILTDMFQELLLADLCLVDMSIDNANVFYELGIRHSFRKRGIVHIQAGRAYMPFDVFNVRTIPYHITPDGVPDPAFLEKDKAAIARVTRDTWASETETIHSPIFNLLDGLTEPDRRTLRTPLATGFWREYNEWKSRVTTAQRQKRIGDILLLTEEIKNPLIKEEAIGEAGAALTNLGHHELALNQYRKGLEINSRNQNFRRAEAFLLNRLKRSDEAIVKLEGILADVPRDTEALAYLGRIYKEMWADSWLWIKEKNLRLKMAFDSYHWLVKSFETYLKGYRYNLNEFYPGINALTIGTILIHLADKYDNKKEPDPEIQLVRGILDEMRGTLAFSLEAQAEDESADYWSLASLAELYVLTAELPQQVTRVYRKALTASRRNESFLYSSLGQLEILRSLDMRGEFVKAGIVAIQDELKRIRKEMPEDQSKSDAMASKRSKKTAAAGRLKKEPQVFLFTGYMVDHSGKQQHNFSPKMEDVVRQEISKKLDKYKAGSGDLAFTAGLSAGSELIFAEVCLQKGIQLESHLPVSEAAYVRDFISPGGDVWVERFYKLRNNPRSEELYQLEHVGKPKNGDDLYERNNRWALYCALLHGIDNVRLIALWDGKGGRQRDRDAKLVKHMVDLMRDTGGIVEHIHASKLNHLPFVGEFGEVATRTKGAPKRKSRKK